MGRYFTKRQKEAVAIVDGKDSRLEGDHIKPVIIGGETAVENCQLLTHESNSSKGSHFMQLREWQVEFAEKWDTRKSGRPFLLVAIPGGGKTFAALSIAKNWLAAGNDRRIIVLVPTSNLRKQWMLEAAKLGMQLQTKEFGTNFKDGFSGARRPRRRPQARTRSVRGDQPGEGAGGVSVLAHPLAAVRGECIPDSAIGELAAAGLDGVEVDHMDHDPATRARLRGMAAGLGLLTTGSSDYHGSRKACRLGDSTTDPEIYGEIVRRATGAFPVPGTDG